MAPDSSPPRPEPVAIAIAFAGAVLVALGGITRWVGVAALIAVGPELLRPWLDSARWKQLSARVPWLWPVAIVAVAAAVLLGELARGEPPMSRDHALHYFQTELLVNRMLPTGRLTGWSWDVANGYPFGESYPVFAWLWTGALHLVSFGAIGLRASYALGILVVWLLGTLSVWLLTAWMVGSVGVSPRARAWAGAVASLLYLFDAGASRQGGWNYSMFHGVWPQTLSAVLWVLALVLQARALRTPTPRNIGLAAAVLGASVLAHPFGLLTAVLSGVGWLAFIVLAPAARALGAGRLVVWGLVHGVAAAVCIGWVSVFFGSAAAMERSPVPWDSLERLSIDLLRGDLLASHWAWATVLALGGAAYLLRSDRGPAWLVVGIAIAMLVLGSTEAITLLRLDLLSSGFKNLQFPRFAIPLRLLVFALGGAAPVLLAPRLAAAAIADPRSRRITRFVGGLILAPLVAASIGGAPRLIERPIGALDTLEGSGLHAADRDLRAALETDTVRLQIPARVAFLRYRMGGGMYPVASFADAGAAVVLDGHVATVNFAHRVDARDPATLRTLGVTHVVHDHELTPEDAALAEQLERVGEYGPYKLERLRDPTAAVLAAAPHNDAAQLAVDRIGVDAWNVDIRGIAGPTRLVLLPAPHLRWQATFAGEPLAIGEDHGVPGLTRMGVLVPGPGRVELRYTRRAFERVAAWISALALVACLLALVSNHTLRWRERIMTPKQRALWLALAGLTIVIASAFAVRRQDYALARTWDALGESEFRQTEHRFASDLIDTGNFEVVGAGARNCDGLLGKDVLLGCSEADHAPALAMLFRDPYLYRCLGLSIAPDGRLDLVLGTATAGRVLGMLQRVTTTGRARTLTYDAGSGARSLGTRRRTFTGSPGLVVHLQNHGSSPERVCVAAAVFSPSP